MICSPHEEDHARCPIKSIEVKVVELWMGQIRNAFLIFPFSSCTYAPPPPLDYHEWTLCLLQGMNETQCGYQSPLITVFSVDLLIFGHIKSPITERTFWFFWNNDNPSLSQWITNANLRAKLTLLLVLRRLYRGRRCGGMYRVERTMLRKGLKV